MSIRELVRSYAAARSLTPNAVASLVAGVVSRSQVFDFFNGTHDLTTEKADAILVALSIPLPIAPLPGASWVIRTPDGFWAGRRYGSLDKATRFSCWDEAVEHAQETAGLPADGLWEIVAV